LPAQGNEIIQEAPMQVGAFLLSSRAGIAPAPFTLYHCWPFCHASFRISANRLHWAHWIWTTRAGPFWGL